MTEHDVLKAILNPLKYEIDIEIGEIYSVTTSKPLYRFYCGRDTTRYPFVRICHQGKKTARSVSKLIWMYSRRTVVPKDCEVHHRDLNHQNNNWENLICIHKDDHRLLHRLLEGYVAEPTPF